MSTEGAGPCGSEFSGGLGPLPLSPVEVGDLILQPREHVLSLGWRNREQLYPESQVRAYVASAVAAERERCAQYLRDAADRLIPEGKRTNQVDRHVAHVLACKGDEIAHGIHLRA